MPAERHSKVGGDFNPFKLPRTPFLGHFDGLPTSDPVTSLISERPVDVAFPIVTAFSITRTVDAACHRPSFQHVAHPCGSDSPAFTRTMFESEYLPICAMAPMRQSPPQSYDRTRRDLADVAHLVDPSRTLHRVMDCTHRAYPHPRLVLSVLQNRSPFGTVSPHRFACLRFYAQTRLHFAEIGLMPAMTNLTTSSQPRNSIIRWLRSPVANY